MIKYNKRRVICQYLYDKVFSIYMEFLLKKQK